MTTQIWAHRGASREFPENTMPAFRRAIELGADGIELDVQRTADGVLVVFHDENLVRMTGLNKEMKDASYKELQELICCAKTSSYNTLDHKEYYIPRLEEVLDLIQDKPIYLNIELKNSLHFYDGMEEEILALVAEKGVEEQIYYSSFNHESVKKLVSLGQSERAAILYSCILADDCQYLASIGAKNLHPLLNSLQKPSFLENARKNNVRVHVWTVNEDAHLKRGLQMGVDAIITDEVAKAVSMKNEMKAMPKASQ